MNWRTTLIISILTIILTGCMISNDTEMTYAGEGFSSVWYGKEVYIRKKMLKPNHYTVDLQAHQTTVTKPEIIALFKKKAKTICQAKKPKYTYTIKKDDMLNTIAYTGFYMEKTVQTYRLIADLHCQ